MAIRNISIYVGVIALSYVWLFYIKRGPVYETDKRLDGKTVLITGANAGLGKATAIEMAKMGARVVIASRNRKKSIAAKNEIMKESGNANVRMMVVDLENFDSVRTFAKEFDETEEYIDILINNAGALTATGKNENGLNRLFTINHLGPFLLTNLLLEKMKNQSTARPVRIVNVASEIYRLGKIDIDNLYPDDDDFFAMWKSYGNSKLANIYFTSELQRRLKDYKITAYSLHPGLVLTDLGDQLSTGLKMLFFPSILFGRSPYYGCQTTLYCALDDKVIYNSGSYFSGCQLQELTDHAKDKEIANKLWDKSFEIINSIH